MIIDVHAHIVPPAYLDLLRSRGGEIRRQIVTLKSGAPAIRDYERDFPLPPSFHDIEVQFADMARKRVDCQVLSVPPYMYHYDLPAELGAELSRLFNDAVIGLAKTHPGRVLPMATLPLQDAAMAVAELERVVALGVRSIEIGASVHTKELDDPSLEPFWSAAERLGVLVFIHPLQPPGRERMLQFHLFNLIGFLAETTLAAARLIFSGTLDRHPDLKILLAHAGGMLPWIEGRFDQAYRTIEACRGTAALPSAYLHRFYYDIITYRPGALAYLVQKVGAGRIMLGTDYPFPIGEDDPVGMVDRTEGLSEADRAAIKGGTAQRLLIT